jgi:hypothetical protein
VRYEELSFEVHGEAVAALCQGFWPCFDESSVGQRQLRTQPKWSYQSACVFWSPACAVCDLVLNSLQMEESDYQAALALRDAYTKVMKDALTASSVMLMPLLAGASPKAKNVTAPLDKAGQKIADLTMTFAALAAMCGCPVAVLPVPPVTEGGAPWAVLLVGRHRCDAQVLQLAVRLSSHVQKTAAALKKVLQPPLIHLASCHMPTWLCFVFCECYCCHCCNLAMWHACCRPSGKGVVEGVVEPAEPLNPFRKANLGTVNRRLVQYTQPLY